LQTLTGGIGNSNGVNGTSSNDDHTHDETNGLANGGSSGLSADVVKTASDTEAVPTSGSPLPVPSAVANATSVTGESPLPALNSAHETELAAESTSTEKNKGKGRKSDAELEQDLVAESRLVQEQEQENEIAAAEGDVVVGDIGGEDEDEKYSPQEMVRRRWARKDVSSSE
jgi:hypothetical protein